MLKQNSIYAILCVLTVFSALYQGCSKHDSNQQKADLSTKTEKQSITSQKKVVIDSATSIILSDSAETLSKVGTDTAKPRSNARSQVSPSNKFEKPLHAVNTLNKKSGDQTMGIAAVYDCGSYLSGNYYTSGHYRYPDQWIDLRTPVGTVNISVQSYDVPNRFDVYDEDGNFVTSSGWMGYANYYGPWGSSLNTS